MGKRMEKLFPAFILFFVMGALHAQNGGRPKIKIQPIPRLEIDRITDSNLSVVLSHSGRAAGSFSGQSIPDSRDFPMPGENLNGFFSEKMDSLENTWEATHFFQFETTDTDSREVYPSDLPDSVYIRRLKAIEQVIDLSYNKVVRNFIELYTEKRRDQVEMMLGLSAYYFPIFEEALDRHGLPLDLKYLPIIESALNPKAHSRMGASGLWQFMFRTGRQMDLEITSFVDERRDPLKSTDAAVRYFKNLYERYGNWHLAIAAYNCGPGNVNRAIRRAGGKKDYWAIYYRLPRETRGYVPAFIAAAYFVNYFREHNLHPRKPDMPIQADTVWVHDYLHFNQIAEVVDIGKEHLRSLNPMYRRDVIPAKAEKPYPLTLPENKVMEFIDRDTLVFAYEREKYFPDNTLVKPTSRSASYYTPADIEGKEKVYYTVKSGDNVGFIAEWFHVRASDLRYWNNIHRNLIRAGEKLLIYVPEGQKAKYEKLNEMTFARKQAFIGETVREPAIEKPLDPGYEYYTVKRGDTLWDIAKRFAGITSQEILRLNNLSNGASLSIGQKLKIKAKGTI